MKLPAPQPKPTSSSSQLESAVSLWDGGPTVAGVWECGPGSLLVLPQGWRGTWVVRETIRKTYVIVGD